MNFLQNNKMKQYNFLKNKIAKIFNSELALLIFWVLVLSTLNLNSVALNEINAANYKVNLETFFILIKIACAVSGRRYALLALSLIAPRLVSNIN